MTALTAYFNIFGGLYLFFMQPAHKETRDLVRDDAENQQE